MGIMISGMGSPIFVYFTEANLLWAQVQFPRLASRFGGEHVVLRMNLMNYWVDSSDIKLMITDCIQPHNFLSSTACDLIYFDFLVDDGYWHGPHNPTMES